MDTTKLIVTGIVKDDLLALLRGEVDRRGSQLDVAIELGVSASYLSDILAGRREPGEKVLSAMGFTAATVYVPNIEFDRVRAFQRHEDNVQCVVVSQPLLAEMMTRGWRGCVECVAGLEPGAEFVKAILDPYSQDSLYVFRHPDFAGVAWEDMPRRDVVFQKIEVQP